MAINKRKTTTAIVAGITAAALVLGGTFAWTSISQRALNETSGIVNVGGRLHDDFNGTNKDIYVENFTNAVNGGQPIYARIRLDEYMEVGSEAGDLDNPNRKAVPVVSTMVESDESTWVTHIPLDNDTVKCETGCNSAQNCLLHNHWEWDLDGSTVFMPTFNKDKDSKEADINGTYGGTNPNDKVYYDDYVVYTTADGGIIVDMTDENFVKPDGAVNASPLTEAKGDVKIVTGMAQYDNDTDDKKNEAEGQYQLIKETHTAKETQSGTVMTMQQWIAGGNLPGNYWVYDDDGWAYWANPIMPGEATGLLLDSIKMVKNPGEKCYYAINVVAQFATVGDWEYFENKDGTVGLTEDSDAMKVMKAASGNVPTVTVDGENYVNVGNTYSFTATASRGEVSGAAAGDFEWYVTDENGQMVATSIATIAKTENGADVTVSKTVPDGTTLIVAARCTDSTYLGATGSTQIVIRNADALVPEVDVTVNAQTVSDIDAISLTADVMHNFAAYEGADIAWSITDENGNAISAEVATVNDGVLTIAQKEGLVKLKITASVTLSGNTRTDTVDFEINASDYCDTCGEKYDDNGFCVKNCTSGQYEPAVLSADGETYEVANAGQMFYMANKINADVVNEFNFTLMKDIDLENRQWTPIGYYIDENNKNYYSGTFDGNGHAIKGLSILSTSDNQGLFGLVQYSTVKNFSVDGKITISGGTGGSHYGVIGQLGIDSTASHIHSSLDITCSNSEADDGLGPTYCGGIAGTGHAGAKITNCSFSGNISGTLQTTAGILGYGAYGASITIENCLFVGTIEMHETRTVYANGILGYHNGANASTTSVSNCFSYGTIVAADENNISSGAAALVGCFRSGKNCNVSNSYYLLTEKSTSNLPAIGNGGGSDDNSYTVTNVQTTTAEDIANGMLCKNLGDGWTQDADDAYPKPNNLF